MGWETNRPLAGLRHCHASSSEPCSQAGAAFPAIWLEERLLSQRTLHASLRERYPAQHGVCGRDRPRYEGGKACASAVVSHRPYLQTLREMLAGQLCQPQTLHNTVYGR